MSICRTLAKYITCYRNAAGDAQKYIDAIPEDIEYYVLGSTSASHAYDFKAVGAEGFNGAVGPQTVSYDYRLFEQYGAKMKPGGVVIWSPCVFSMCVAEYPAVLQHIRYYYVLKPQSVYKSRLILIDMFGAILYPPVRCFARPVLGAVRIIWRKLRKNARQSSKSTCLSELDISAKSYYTGWKKEFQLNDEHVSGLTDIDERADYCLSYLGKIAALCRQRQLRFFIVIPPVSRAMLRYITNADLERYLLSRLHGWKEDVHVLNYFDDVFFSDDKFFENAICMNETGRRLFTKEVITRIGAMKHD